MFVAATPLPPCVYAHRLMMFIVSQTMFYAIAYASTQTRAFTCVMYVHIYYLYIPYLYLSNTTLASKLSGHNWCPRLLPAAVLYLFCVSEAPPRSVRRHVKKEKNGRAHRKQTYHMCVPQYFAQFLFPIQAPAAAAVAATAHVLDRKSASSFTHFGSPFCLWRSLSIRLS